MADNGFTADPEGLMAKGKRVNELFEAYVNEKNAVAKTTDAIKSAWSGADSGGYITAIHSYDADFQKLAQILEQMSNIMYTHGSRLASSRDAIKDAASRL